MSQTCIFRLNLISNFNMFSWNHNWILVLKKMMSVFSASTTMKRIVLHFSSTDWSLAGLDVSTWLNLFQKFLQSQTSWVLRCHIFYRIVVDDPFYFFNNGDSHVYSDKAMICLSVIDIKTHFSDEDDTVALLPYNGIVHQMLVLESEMHLCRLEESMNRNCVFVMIKLFSMHRHNNRYPLEWQFLILSLQIIFSQSQWSFLIFTLKIPAISFYIRKLLIVKWTIIEGPACNDKLHLRPG